MMMKKLGVVLAALTMIVLGVSGVSQGSSAHAAPAAGGWCDAATLQNNGGYTYYVPTVGQGGSKNCVMWEGASSSAVSALQAGLTCNHITTGVDGAWGPATTNSVLTLQRQSGITADGEYGPNTHNAVIYWGARLTNNPFPCVVDWPI